MLGYLLGYAWSMVMTKFVFSFHVMSKLWILISGLFFFMDLNPTGWRKNAMTKYSGINTIINYSSKIKVIMTCMRLMLRKDVLEQKVNQVLESVGYSSRGLVYTVLKPSLSSSFLL